MSSRRSGTIAGPLNRRSGKNTMNSEVARMHLQLARVNAQVNKITPFQVRRNAQHISIPAHRESGLNIERVFRLVRTLSANGSPQVITENAVTTDVLAELGVGVVGTGNALDFTLKEARFFSSSNLDVQLYYRAGNAVDRNTNFSDYSSSAGISSIQVVYPVASRMTWTNPAGTTPLFSISAGTSDTATTPAFVVLDLLVKISSRLNAFDPDPNTVLREEAGMTREFSPVEGDESVTADSCCLCQQQV